MKRRWVSVVLLVTAIALSAPALGACRRAKTALDIRGSDTMVNLGARWAEKFMAKNQKYTVAVQGGGSGTGATALINRNCDIAQMSRAMKESEQANLKSATGKEAREHIVAYDGVAVVVHPGNPVDQLTEQQLARIFRGEASNWNEFGGPDSSIVVLARDTSSGTHVFVKEHIVWERGAENEAEYGPKVQFLTSNQAIYTEVKQNPQAIGYIGLGYLDGAVKALAVKRDDAAPAVMPSVATVKDKTYPIARPLYNCTAGEPEGLVKTYLDFVLGPEGQAIVEDLGFVPVR